MNHKIDKSLEDFAVDITTLEHLSGNPRTGNVNAIMASYAEFGQLRPIVIRPNDDGTSTIIAGNHQVMAAKKLGWTHIAAIQYDADDSRAVAFALADNRTSELGRSDSALITDLLGDIVEDYSELLDGLGWDDFEIASMEENMYEQERMPEQASRSEYMTPVIQPIADIGAHILSSLVREDDEGERQIVAPSNVSHDDVAVRGSGLVTNQMQVPNAPKAVVQYTIVFDEPEQQRRWYDFIKWLRNESAYDGDTTAGKLISFIDAHSEC
jgi:hypothetical protein